MMGMLLVPPLSVLRRPLQANSRACPVHSLGQIPATSTHWPS